MEVTVELGEGVLTDDGPAAATSSNPALDQARKELTDIATNPENPRFSGYQRGDAQVSAYLDTLYKKALPANAPGTIEEGLSVTTGGPVQPLPGETPEEAEVRARNEVILAPLKAEWGADFDRRFAAACRTPNVLFEGEGMAEIYHELGTSIRMKYGPKGEAAAVKFLAELEEIRQQGG